MNIQDFPKELLDAAQEISLKQGDVLIHEGEEPTHFYFLISGGVEVLKKAKKGKEHQIAVLKEGKMIGEIGLIDKKKRSASVRALKPCSLLAFQINKLSQKDSDFLTSLLTRELADRLRDTNETTVVSLEKKLKEAKLRDQMGFTLIYFFATFAAYIILISVLTRFFAYTPYIFVSMTILLGTVSFIMMRRSGFALSFFGLVFKPSRQSIQEALLVSFFLIGLTTCVKWLYVQIKEIEGVPLIDPLYDHVSLTSFLIFIGIYIVIAPIQQLLARGILQSLMTYLLSNGRRKVWIAIVTSNLLVVTLHDKISLEIVACFFIPGMFWGWLYDKQKSLVGVSIGQILFGVWTFAFLGFMDIFY